MKNDNLVRAPKIHRLPDVYKNFVAKLLKENPKFKGYRNRKRRIPNFWIYTARTYNPKAVEVINFDRWQKIMHTAMYEARARIIEGESYNMGHYLGVIAPRHIERNHANKKVDWGRTRKQPKVISTKSGKLVPEIMIYHTDDTYARIGWKKTKSLSNETVYEFSPCKGKDGFTKQFSEANKLDELLKYRYKFHPFKIKGAIKKLIKKS